MRAKSKKSIRYRRKKFWMDFVRKFYLFFTKLFYSVDPVVMCRFLGPQHYIKTKFDCIF